MPHTLLPLPQPDGSAAPAGLNPRAKKRSAWRTPLLVVLALLALLLLAAVLGAASLATHLVQQVTDGSEGVRVVINGQPWFGWGDEVLPGGWLGTLVTWLVGAVLSVLVFAVVLAVVFGVVGFAALPLLVAVAAVVLAVGLPVVLAVLLAVFGGGLAVVFAAALVLSPVWLVGWLLWRLIRRTRAGSIATPTATPNPAPTARMAA